METTTETAPVPAATYGRLPIDSIHESSWNPRKHFNDAQLSELADSIRAKDVIEPIIVRPVAAKRGSPSENPHFEIIAGARRHRAAILAGLQTIPALVRELDDLAALELAVIENTQRADVNPIDEALGYQALIKAAGKGSKAAYTPAVIAAKVGKSESYVYRRIHLLELEPHLQKAVAEDRLPVRYAEVLLRMTPELRAEATDLDGGCVWIRSPLFDGKDKDFVPTAADLQPLAELEYFARRHSAMSPQAEATKHLQPELGAVIEKHVENQLIDSSTVEEEAEVRADLIALSEDPMVRMNLRAAENAPIPLPPSKWREVKGAKNRCGYEKPGVIVHGGAYRVLEVCTKRSCAKHWPQAKKKAAPAAGARSKPEKLVEQSWEREQRLEREAQARWAPIWPLVKPILVEHLRPLKLTAATLLLCLGSNNSISAWALRRAEQDFGVKLKDATMGQVMALAFIGLARTRAEFLSDVKRFKFPIAKLEAIEKAHAAKEAAEKTAGASAKGKKATPAKKGKAAA